MTEVTAKIVEDSISEGGARLTTMQLRYPRWIHSEVMTHRVFSRNASSSRAIPTKKMLESIEADPAEPLFWGLNEPGMQSRKELTDQSTLKAAKALWLHPMRVCIRAATDLAELCGLHKQLINRAVEPWMHIDVIISSTDFDNFFALRCHPDAEPTIQVLAWEMADLYYAAKPAVVAVGGWHLPYVKPEERESLPLEAQKVCSVARCARVSYRTHDGANPSSRRTPSFTTGCWAVLIRAAESRGICLRSSTKQHRWLMLQKEAETSRVGSSIESRFPVRS